MKKNRSVTDGFHILSRLSVWNNHLEHKLLQANRADTFPTKSYRLQICTILHEQPNIALGVPEQQRLGPMGPTILLDYGTVQ